MSFWNKTKKAKVTREVNYWIRALMLESWDIRLEFEVNDSADYAANVSIDNSYTRALITVNAHALKPPNILNEVICHELLHVVLSGLSNSSAQLLSGTLVTHRELIEVEEKTVEHLTRILNRGI